jgi:beta-glucanase (GH16 family)
MYTFDPNRIWLNGTMDVSKFDFTVDYGANQIKSFHNGVNLSISKKTDGKGDGIRLSTTRFHKYGKFSGNILTLTLVTMRVTPSPGVISTFITMSPEKDEIDFEFVGSGIEVESNVFYKGIKEYNVHGRKHATSPGFHTYTIDWKSTGIIWLVDNMVVRSYLNDENAVSRMTPSGKRWFPDTPSQIQFSIWDGCAESAETWYHFTIDNSKWAKGPVNWNNENLISSSIHSLEVIWYNL